jgi:DNA-directed RNA polymerase specialized sigma24 family protein
MSGVGDQGRVEAVYRSLHPRLWRSLLAYTGDAELASDAEAEAFAQVLGRGDAVDDVAAWVWRSAFHIASGRRGGGRAPTVSGPRRAQRQRPVP